MFEAVIRDKFCITESFLSQENFSLIFSLKTVRKNDLVWENFYRLTDFFLFSTQRMIFFMEDDFSSTKSNKNSIFVSVYLLLYIILDKTMS